MEWVAMPFGLCIALATFQRMIIDIALDLHKFITICLDDDCLFNRTLENRLEHMRIVLQRFKEEGLKFRLKKCFFGLQEIESPQKKTRSHATKKVEAVAYWPLPTTQKEVRNFVQFCNFYYAIFIHHFSDLTTPLSD
jgi:hypothetical protein